jgi:hypothetical protein
MAQWLVTRDRLGADHHSPLWRSYGLRAYRRRIFPPGGSLCPRNAKNPSRYIVVPIGGWSCPGCEVDDQLQSIANLHPSPASDSNSLGPEDRPTLQSTANLPNPPVPSSRAATPEKQDTEHDRVGVAQMRPSTMPGHLQRTRWISTIRPREIAQGPMKMISTNAVSAGP